MVTGMNGLTGESLDGLGHLTQSIRDILTTPLGSRVMRRDYGSLLPRLVDRPINDRTLVDVYAATADALYRWEPRFRLARVRVERATAGRLELRLVGRHKDGTPGVIEGVVI